MVPPALAGSTPMPDISAGLAAGISHDIFFHSTGIVLAILISFIGIRMLNYWRSFALHSSRYRYRDKVTTRFLKEMQETIPFVKVQWTTKGSLGSTEVILRGIRQLEELAAEDPDFYRQFLSAEVITENQEQADLISKTFASSPLAPPSCVVTPASYQTPKGTQLKARQLHYLVELRRGGWNRKPGKTFIIHFDEDTMMVPAEFRKMLVKLALTDKSILTGPIYYPLEYEDASRLARATEASRPITCFECRTVMETGVPLHVHGSNLAVEEEFENRLGWDIGLLDGVPFVAEDYMFGMDAFLKEGRDAFGWHGCVALEQPPFSFASVFRQRYRWIFGVLQGMSVDTKLPDFAKLPWRLRMKVIWGTRYRISTFALGTFVGALSLLYIPFWLIVAISKMTAGQYVGIPWELTAWFALIGSMWLGANIVGSWINVMDSGFSRSRKITEVARAVCISPVAGMMENLSGLKAVIQWMSGFRQVVWTTTPSTKAADDVVNGRTEHVALPLEQTVIEAPVPWKTPSQPERRAAAVTAMAAILVIAVYIGVPLVITAQDFGSRSLLEETLSAAAAITVLMSGIALVIWQTAQGKHLPRHAMLAQAQARPRIRETSPEALTEPHGLRAIGFGDTDPRGLTALEVIHEVNAINANLETD